MTTRPHVRRGAIVVAIGFWLTACAQPEVPADRFYRLDLASVPKAAPASRPVDVVEVDKPIANGVVAGRAIVRADSASPMALTTYHYHYWAEPPANLLRDVLVACVRDARVANRVVTREMRVRADFRIFGRLKRLEHVRDSPRRVIVDMDLGVRSNSDGELLHLGSYVVEEPVDDPTVAAAIAAFERALATVCARLIDDFSAAISSAS